MAKFSFDIPGVDAWLAKTEQKSLKVVRASFRELSFRIIDDAPVRTGFMVASAKARLNPRRALKERERPAKYWEPEARELKKQEVADVSKRMTKVGQSIGLSFVANYTSIVHDGLSRSPAQPFIAINMSAWPSIVRTEIAKARK